MTLASIPSEAMGKKAGDLNVALTPRELVNGLPSFPASRVFRHIS